MARLAARVTLELTHRHQLAFALIAPDLTIVRASTNFGAFALNRERVEGRPLTDVFWEFVGSEPVLTAILRGEDARLTLERINRDGPDGTPLYLTLQALPVDSQRPGTGLLLLVEDTTAATLLEQRMVHHHNELRLAHEQLEKVSAELSRLNQLRSFLLAMLGHDLRSPLTAIQLNAGLVRNALTGDAAQALTALANIGRQVNLLHNLIANVIDLERIERGQLVVRSMPCDVCHLVRDLVETVYPAAARRGRTLHLELADPALVIPADSELLRQALQNLIDNAMKYTGGDGQIRVTVRPEGEWAVVDVSDNGPGLGQHQMKQLFQPYYRADGSRHSEVKGYGLGLFIAKTLIEAHRGQVTVQSEAGWGSTFTIRLPRA